MNSVTKGAPITGEDLKHVAKLLRNKISAILWLFGCSYTQWNAICKRDTKDIRVTQTLLARLLLDHPELSPIPVTPSAAEVFNTIREVDPEFLKRDFAVIMGMQPGSSARLLDTTKPARTSTIVSNYMLLIKNALDRAETTADKRRILDLLRSKAEEEAKSRGIDLKELWHGEGWSPEGEDDGDDDH